MLEPLSWTQLQPWLGAEGPREKPACSGYLGKVWPVPSSCDIKGAPILAGQWSQGAGASSITCLARHPPQL